MNFNLKTITLNLFLLKEKTLPGQMVGVVLDILRKDLIEFYGCI